ncbi:MAG: thioredoxin family protein [Candidatus Marinimicrobia bacterium]|nr:thioredoxin family protein [Candidatus Neomarinimicrobiota bacterium]
MNFRHLQFLLAGSLAVVAPLRGQLPGDIVTASIAIDREEVRSGEGITLRANVVVEPGWHIYSNDLSGFGPVPTHFELDDSSKFSALGPFQEPPPARVWDEGFEIDVGWHSGAVELSQTMALLKDQPPGPLTLSGQFVFMACTETFCLPPAYQDFSFQLLVEEGPVREAYRFDAGESVLAAVTGLEQTELQSAIREGLWSFLLLSLGMGLVALLTPCVFPMIPITVSFFLKQGESGRISPLKSAGLYATGIIVIYSALGIFLALTLGASGANQLASNPWVNLLLGGLFVYFALSLFGMYEIQLPSRLRQFSLAQESRGGLMGIFFMSLTFTITSFTCTIQFVGLLLVAASQGHYLWPAIGMIAYSVTFALPFFLLALFPQYLARLPKSGGWLNSVKVVMGFLELAAAFKFVSNSDLVWNWGLLTHQVVLAAWTVILLLTGLYLLGKIRLPHDSPLETIPVPRMLISSTFLMFSLLLGAGLVGQKIPSLVAAYLPPRLTVDNTGVVLGNQLEQLRWFGEYDEALAQAQLTNQPIFLDVTGYTCTNCRWMEANIFTIPDVAERFEKYVLLRLYTDGGPNFREKQRFVVERFGTVALPLYVILAPDGREISRFPGMTRDSKKFVAFLDKGFEPRPSLTLGERRPNR